MAQHNISQLPAEVIDNILRQITNGHDRVSFSKTCRHFYKSFAMTSMEDIDLDFAVSRVNKTLKSRHPRRLSNARTTSIQRINIDEWTSTVHADHIVETVDACCYSYIDCTKANCRACTLGRSLVALDAFCASQRNKMPKPRSLTFRGNFGDRTQSFGWRTGSVEHQFISSPGLAALILPRFAFNMHWKYWDMAILDVLSTSQLVVLSLPLGVPFDCLELGRALVTMPVLRSLTITDMADHPLFLGLFPFLGLGIRARSASLRELDLSITNCNRPDFYCDTWERVTLEQEPFVKPVDLDYFFSAIFPTSLEEIPEFVRQRYLDFEYQVKKDMQHPEDCVQRLRLEKFRLKRIDLPAHSFNKVIDGTNLKELRLPYCDVDQDVWLSIRTNQLVTLEELDYELLLNYELRHSKTFERFLQSQNALHSLSFARPPDQYRVGGDWVWFAGDDAPVRSMQPYQTASPLSQATAWTKGSCISRATPGSPDLPTLERILDTLSNANIKHLLLPADMFDIMPYHMSKFGSCLPFLQHLTWGFDYEHAEIRKAFEENFLPKIPSTLRKITFLSLHLPGGYNGIDRNNLAFNAPNFQGWIVSFEDRVPQTIRYLRYRHLSSPYQGERQKTTVWYHRQEPKNGGWWIELDEYEGEMMFEEERTPHVWPVTQAEKRV